MVNLLFNHEKNKTQRDQAMCPRCHRLVNGRTRSRSQDFQTLVPLLLTFP